VCSYDITTTTTTTTTTTNTSTMVYSVIDPNAVYVSPPDRSGYAKYTDYLQDVVHFKEFLDRHAWAISAQTKHRGSSVTHSFSKPKVDKDVSFVEDSTASDFDAPEFTPAPSVVKEQKVESPAPPVAKFDEKEFHKRLDAKGLLSKADREALPSVDGVSGSVQVGKKATKARLKKYCSDNLVEEIIDNISRNEAILQAVELQMKVVSKAVGRKLIRSDLPKGYKLDNKPKPAPGHASYVDYAALWESSESDQH
jgi:hypothetical protein